MGGKAQQEQSFGCAKVTGTRHRACPVGPLLHSLGSTSLCDANLPPLPLRPNASKTSGTAPRRCLQATPSFSMQNDWPVIKLTLSVCQALRADWSEATRAPEPTNLKVPSASTYYCRGITDDIMLSWPCSFLGTYEYRSEGQSVSAKRAGLSPVVLRQCDGVWSKRDMFQVGPWDMKLSIIRALGPCPRRCRNHA